jgi:cytochrome c
MRHALVIGVSVLALAGCGGGATKPQAVPGGDAERGKRLIEHYGCGGCHEIGGVRRANANIGPTLEHFREKQVIAGKLRNTPDDVARWIMNPQKILPGNLMPDLGVRNDEARDIAAYLYGQ